MGESKENEIRSRNSKQPSRFFDGRTIWKLVTHVLALTVVIMILSAAADDLICPPRRF